MITPQYTYDNTGTKIGVFLTIADWNELQQIPGVEELSNEGFSIPEWQICLGKEELKRISNATADLMEWNEAKKQFKL
jgi:hypothetical protein